MSEKHLWEYDHPYYCNEGNYLHSPYKQPDVESHSVFDSWQAFKDAGWPETDPDLNLLFRWDWKAWHLEFPEDYPDENGFTERHVLQLYFILQRKAFNRSIHVNVTEADEAEVRTWLASRADTMRTTWAPFLGGAA